MQSTMKTATTFLIIIKLQLQDPNNRNSVSLGFFRPFISHVTKIHKSEKGFHSPPSVFTVGRTIRIERLPVGSTEKSRDEDVNILQTLITAAAQSGGVFKIQKGNELLPLVRNLGVLELQRSHSNTFVELL